MTRTAHDIEIDLVTSFLTNQFPKKRVKDSLNSKRFVPGIYVSCYFTNDKRELYPIKSKHDITTITILLKSIVRRFFGCDEELAEIAIKRYLGLL